MLRTNGEGMPVGGESEVRTSVAIVGGGPAGAVAAMIVRQQTPDQSVLIIETPTRGKPVAGRTLSREGAQVLREIGVGEEAKQPASAEALFERARAAGAIILTHLAIGRADTCTDHIERLHLDDGRTVVADWYVDASGLDRVLARAVGASDDQTTGENWLLCDGPAGTSEPARLADPSLALTIGHDAGCTLAALHRGEHDTRWLLWSYHESTRRRVNDHAIVDRCSHAGELQLELRRYNIIKPNLVGATRDWIAGFRAGGVDLVPCYVRDGRTLPVAGVHERLFEALKHHTVIADVLGELEREIRASVPAGERPAALVRYVAGLESMLADGWLIGRLDRRRPMPAWPEDSPPHVRVLGSGDRTKPAAVEPSQRAIG